MVNVFSFEELRELKGVKELRHYSPSPPVFSPPDGLLSEPPEGLLPEPPEGLLPEPPDGVVVPPPVVPPGFVVEEVTRMSAASLRVKTAVGELACGTGTELDALYVLCHGEGFLRVGSLLGSDANGENGEVVDLHGVAAEDEFLDALHHVGEDAAYGSCREGCVVARHVLSELVDADGCGDCRTGIVLAVRSWELFVVVFY